MFASLLVMLIAALCGVACYNFICAGVDVPTGQTSKMMMLAGRRSGTRKENLSDVYIAKVADVFARYIHMDALKRSQLENALDIANVEMTPEQFKEFAANIDYFVFEPNIRNLNDLGWRYLAQHMDMLPPPELLSAIDPVPFGKYAMREEQGHFTEHGYISLSGDEWEHERPAEPEKKPSIRERLEQCKKECAEKCKAQPHKEKSAPEL